MRTLYRSRTDRKLAGLCGGIGRTYGVDPGLIRIGFIAAGVFSAGTVLLIYAAASVVLPNEPEFSGPPPRGSF
ncbi:PspC domain-containing protein [Paenibacillus pasadenensis]|uniref:PspC domain-containing protein n=1 Tax=Paenibacillus pasadenensis TaxID=217090 RepID=UPI00203FDC85|nr:PspC domain-containing protein [Paenibacillus pasadenensis]MCM3749610.1 PspC domain-containing protein [Paenibacillus pasadenensis]